ncbi:putative quinol monooxygenase [Kordiimonas marina]|uniref:putative quinol monooxygenase n=1 Tax=Kordiimonas marina TaxID=2872312 RepID=UPI001FF5B023|nr:antibiotic biosynthesis monooxygenase [Kordiimonas marina]MCJ9430619.1 hypothetical protein [Kordiimonas marina]
MIIVSGKIEVSPLYRMELLSIIEPYVRAARKAFGNLRFHISEDCDHSGNFYVYEEWDAVTARGLHMRTETARYFRRMLKAMHVLAIELNQYEVSKVI